VAAKLRNQKTAAISPDRALQFSAWRYANLCPFYFKKIYENILSFQKHAVHLQQL